ncbi:hypothetical protein HOY34_03115 [Xinfangfangia sp. D13-10-4-6]|uniref:YraN family protein n=1 Tax=Pseudogemmobacter hezensis TaxID=2737662 RepID=UPI0015530CF6|nr:YraN family protein [Pseudogemmobacter hezensis]NPD14187.1 hypothetical protein [Pseudogemmobacter hezensis]
MPLDVLHEDFSPQRYAREQRGLRNHLSGRAAEEAVARHYRAGGYRVLQQRWRGQAGEIDLIAAKGDDLVIVEVKSARSHDIAAGYFGPAQQRRLGKSAENYLFDVHLAGRDPMIEVDMRFDLALVDAMGRIDIVEAAFFL